MRRQTRTYAVCYWDPEDEKSGVKWLTSYLYGEDVNEIFNQFVCIHPVPSCFSVHELTDHEIRLINRLSRELLKRNKDDNQVEYKIQHPGADDSDEPIYHNPLFAVMDAVCNNAESIAILKKLPRIGYVPYDVVFPELIRV